ncbi:MAG: hypothetical protein ACI38Q_01315 [Candidatus Bruticola sp.]
MKKMSGLSWFKSTICAAAIALYVCCPVSAESTPEERFPINGDIDINVAETPTSVNRAKAVSKTVPAEIKTQVKADLRELYNAYRDKNVDKVLQVLHECIESSALEYAGRHKEDPEAADKIRDAYKAFHEDIFNHKDYVLDPFTLEFCTYQTLENGNIEVSSAVPVISSKSMDFKEETPDQIHYMTVSLRLGRFVYAHKDNGWHIVEMDLF